MTKHATTHRRFGRGCARANARRRGFVMVVALVMMSLMVALAVSFASMADMNVQTADAAQNTDKALMAAESGLAHIIMLLNGASVPSSTSEAVMTVAGQRLSDRLDGTANIRAGTIARSATLITVPTIILSSDQSYTARITPVNEGLRVTATGRYLGATRSVSMRMSAKAGATSFFDYGVASRSPIRVTGNASITGVNSPREADVLSATYSTPQAVRLTGNCDIGGDISTSNPASYVTTAGNISIGGVSGADMNDHIHIGIGNVEFPEVDPGVFEPYAVNTVNSSTKTNGNKSFENIRIAAGTNPTFGGNITIKGVVFIESPNTVKFTGNLNFTGVIVTEDAGENNLAGNYIQFTGNMSSRGVESLPDEPQFDGLRETPGSMLLAPGFEVKFTGNFNTVNGAMAADKFTFTGNAGGQVDGPVICYGDTDFTLTGNSRLRINRGTYSMEPPGFEKPITLRADPETYAQ